MGRIFLPILYIFTILIVKILIVTKTHKKVAHSNQLFYGRVSVQFCIIAPLRSLFPYAYSLADRKANRERSAKNSQIDTIISWQGGLPICRRQGSRPSPPL